MDWHDGSNGRFSRMRSLVQSTRQSVEMFQQPWDLNSSDVFLFYDGLLLSGNAVQAAVILARCQASAAVQLNTSLLRGLCWYFFWYDSYGTYRLPQNFSNQLLKCASTISEKQKPHQFLLLDFLTLQCKVLRFCQDVCNSALNDRPSLPRRLEFPSNFFFRIKKLFEN